MSSGKKWAECELMERGREGVREILVEGSNKDRDKESKCSMGLERGQKDVQSERMD